MICHYPSHHQNLVKLLLHGRNHTQHCASINVSDFGLIIIVIGKSLLLCMSHGVSSQHVVFWLWTTCSNLNAPNQIRIILQFVGGHVGASAVGSKVLPSVVLILNRPTNGVVCQVLFHPGKPSVAA
jgi:hypothetical protein